MTRPNLDPAVFVNGTEAWDALLRDFLSGITKTPYPVPEYANAAALPAAASYQRCLATTADNNKLWFSDGTIWKEVNLL